MKTILTLLFVVLCGSVSLANTNDQGLKLKLEIENNLELNISKIDVTENYGIVVVTNYNDIKVVSETKVVRLYKYKNSRIKKALKFTTKRNKAKMA